MAAYSDSKVPWHLKAFSLVTVTTLTTAFIVLMRISKIGDVEPYASSTCVLLAEIIKLVVSLIALGFEKGSFRAFHDSVIREIICDPQETFKLLIPSSLYAWQNNLVYIALENLDAATYQISYQGKILTTAMFSVLLLRKRISKHQWMSLLMLTAGVILVQLRSVDLNSPAPKKGNRLIGFICVVISIVTSGISGVYFEYLVKFGSVEKTSLYLRNSQLGIFSVLINAVVVLGKDWGFISEHGFFGGYNLLVWSLPIIMAASGLSVALTLKYADNILKGFATSISIILTALISYFCLGDLDINYKFVIGTGLVLWATFEYGRPAKENSVVISGGSKHSPEV